MSASRDDGGPAFPPNAGWEDDDSGGRGMSLRDWFAGQALAGMLADPNVAIGDADEAEERKCDLRLGRCSYRIADAMLAERGK